MNSDPELYSQHHTAQTKDARLFVETIYPKMSWSDEDVVMDIGCRTGDNTKNVLLPAIPKLKVLLAFDIMENAINYAKEKNAVEKIVYHVADIEDRLTLKKEWISKITKIFSIYVFHWTKNQKVAFKNVFDLLTPGGEAAAVFTLTTSYWKCHEDLIQDPKWRKYIQDADPCIPLSHYLNYGDLHYRHLLEDVGFQVLLCEEEKRLFAFENDLECRAFCSTICAFASAIPDHLKEEFWNDLFKLHLKHNGRSANGKARLLHTTLTFHVYKPK